jgi:hypothetical protein
MGQISGHAEAHSANVDRMSCRQLRWWIFAGHRSATSRGEAQMTPVTRFGKRVVLMVLLSAAGLLAAQAAGPEDMTFFLTSAGSGKGADLGGLEGADAHCVALAAAVGSTKENWRAYLSTTAPGGDAGVNARDRIGKGPWQNVKGVVIAKDVDDLHSPNTNINKETALTEKGEIVPGRVDPVNTHDVLTGSDPQGMYSTAGGDTTCGNWTKSGDDGSAIVGHHDHMGLKVSRHMMSWNSSHGTRGCSPEGLKSTGGAGLFYCFVAN